MTNYKMLDGTILKTENAVKSWDEETDWDGHNHISRATGSQWVHQTLHLTRKGQYWTETTSQYQGSLPHAELLSPEEATRWLLTNERNLPTDLKALRDKIEEQIRANCIERMEFYCNES